MARKKIQTTAVYKRLDEAVRAGKTIVLAQGGARSGKTYNIVVWLVVYALRNPGTRITVARKTLPSLKGSVLLDFEDVVRRMEVEVRSNRSELTYVLGNGSWFEFISCDNEAKLRGRKRDVLFVNEANELSAMEHQQLALRTTRLTILDYNPSISDDHWLVPLAADPRAVRFITTYKDNPFIEETIVREIEGLRAKNESLWRVYGLGVQATVEGLVFTNVTVVDEIPPYLERRWGAVDFGYTNDPTAVCEVAVDGADLYIDEKCYRTDMLTSDIIRELKADFPAGTKIISESAEPRLVQEIYRAGLNIHPVVKYPGSIQAGITKMMEYRLCVTRTSADALKELRNYVWSRDKEGKWLNTPVDYLNHAIDAVRYVVMSELLGGERRKFDLSGIESAAY